MKCAVCHVEMTATDAEFAVPTDDGPVHRECYDGETPMTAAQEEAENDRRRDHGDPPLPPSGAVSLSSEEIGEQLERAGMPPVPECPECHAEPSINGGRGLLCRGRSMLP